MVEAENGRTVLATSKLITKVEKKAYRSGKMSVKIINDKSVPLMLSFTMEFFNPFYDEFHYQIQRFIESGRSVFHRNFRHRLYDEPVPPLVLSINDLEIGFMVCLIPLALSAIAFIFEVALSKVKLLAFRLRDTLTVVFVVAAFVDCRTTGI